MKIKYYVMLIVILLVAGYFACSAYIYDESYTSVNMEDINDRFLQVKEAVGKAGNSAYVSEQTINHLEKTYKCEIVFCSNDRYETIVNNSIADQMILLDYIENDQLVGKVIFNGQNEQLKMLYSKIALRLLYIFIGAGIVLFSLFAWIYWEYIRPFRTLEVFATQISKGNLDFPLRIRKHNYFGAFTESFDIMREELKRARLGEFEANKSKKELVASLSHDIKTPVATIKAICEILLLKAKDNLVLDKVMIINQKAEVIDTLISNMFHATLEELKLLKITPSEVESTCIPDFFKEINYDGRINYINEMPECLIIADKLRINQVIDNVINNSYKYAGTEIDVSYMDVGGNIVVTIRDFGPGVPDDELPLLTGKFFRGSNSGGQDGSGLGLYLSKQFMDGMMGSFACENTEGGKGLRIMLTLKKA